MVEAYKKEVEFVEALHKKYLEEYDKTTDHEAIGLYCNEHLKVPGAYWCIGSLKVLKKLDDERKDEICNFLKTT